MTLELGPVLVKDARSVDPAHVVRISGLLTDFTKCGLRNGVVLAKKLEGGIADALADSPEKCPKGHVTDFLAHRLTEHIRSCFTMLRWLLLDQSNTSHGGFSKSASFSRKAKTTELVIINNLVRLMDLDNGQSQAAGCIPCTALVPFDAKTSRSQVLGC